MHKGLIYPETPKGGEARVLKLKKETWPSLNKLVSDLQSVNLRIFQSSKVFQGNWNRLRKKLSERYSKPELRQIRLYDLQHFYGAMLYHKTKDNVKRKLRHRSLKNTLIYIDLADFDSEEYSKVAQTPEEIHQLIEAGFEFVCQEDDWGFFIKRTYSRMLLPLLPGLYATCIRLREEQIA